MTSVQRVVAVVRRTLVRAAGAVQATQRPGLVRLVASVLAVLTGAVLLTPWSWWRHVARFIAQPGWWWLPFLLLLVGLAGVADAVARWWRRDHTRARPAAARAPLFVHVAALLLIAVVAAAALAAGMWVLFGRPDLTAPAATSPPRTTPGTPPAAPGWTPQNTFDAMKIVLSVVAGIGGVVALTVAYRKQGHSEAAEHREDTKLFNERFGKAADQLGSDQAAVRLAGVYSMAGLADDWEEGRQTCINVLCAYLRMPYTPPPTDSPPADIPSPGLPLGTPQRTEVSADARQEQQVRHTIVALIREHLLPAGTNRRARWHGHHFDFTGATFDGGDLTDIHVLGGTRLDFTGVKFPGGTVIFSGAKFSGGLVIFSGAEFSGGTVIFSGAKFSGGLVTFNTAKFSGGTVTFNWAEFSGGSAVSFNWVKFSGGTVTFNWAKFSLAAVAFNSAEFSGGEVFFDNAEFTGGDVFFDSAEFTGGTVYFYSAAFSGAEVVFSRAEFSGGTVNFSMAKFSGGTVNFSMAKFSGGTVNFSMAKFSGGTVNFSMAEFSGGTVNFGLANFSGGAVTFSMAKFSRGAEVWFDIAAEWTLPPTGLTGSEPGVTWPPAPTHGSEPHS